MKKYYLLIIVALILGIVLTGCSLLSNISQVPATEQSGMTYVTKAGPTETEAESFPLYAGQDWEVGEVLVWNDGTKVCVKYRLFDGTGDDPENVVGAGWGLTETHLAIGKSLDDIPTNKSGNPKVGQFFYGDDELVDVDSWQVCILFDELGKEEVGDLDVVCGDELFIAAHAVVEKCITVSETITPELTWSRSLESAVAVFPGYGAQWTQGQGFAIPTPDALVWDGGLSGYYIGYSFRSDISWASWICTQNPSGKSTSGTDLRRFNATFDIPAGYTVTGGTLGSVNSGYEDVIPINDNIYIFVNGGLLFWGGTIEVVNPGTTHFLLMERRDTESQTAQSKKDFPETDGWYMDGTFPAIPSGLFVEGPNALDVFAEEFWTGGGMHELGLTLQVEQTTCYDESAWGAEDIGEIEIVEGKSWATYFKYEVGCADCPSIIESSGINVLETPLNDVSPCATKLGIPQIFPEYSGSNHGGFKMDIVGNKAQIPSATVVADTPVCSYYVHFDDGGAPHYAEGYIQFSKPVMGLIVAGTYNGSDIFYKGGIYTMYDTDSKFGAGITYPVKGDARGLEIFYPDLPDSKSQDNVWVEGDTVYFELSIFDKHDSFRIIVSPEY